MIFIDACLKKQTPYTPVWFMRQAGRYLHEYRALRAQAKDFLALCKNPQLAAQITLQPVDILGVDAAILFSDILVVPLEMGMDLGFYAGEGPKFSTTIKTQADIDRLNEEAHKKLSYVYQSISLTRQKLDKTKALIGFCGAPWTLATYMIEGEGSKNYAQTKKIRFEQPSLLHSLLQKLSFTLQSYLIAQIQAGADAVMIFDSWASALDRESYLEFSWQYCKKIAHAIKSKYPHIPIIIFPKGIAGYLDEIDGEFDVFGVDWGTPLELAKKKLAHRYVLQGNLEPATLYCEQTMLKEASAILDLMQNKGHIFNLGHGMLPNLPREHAIKLVKFIQNYQF